ncbi:MAG: hypothetical protein RL748_98 [Pseudomonadota bacterium]|jgi:DNA-binding transcriptional ArsR family regulator
MSPTPQFISPASKAFSEDQAVRALAALAQTTRLRMFRALVVAGPEGLNAGSLSSQLEIAPSALSFHLKELSHAGLIEARAEGRFQIYTACFSEMNALLAFLTENCCQGSGGCC